MLTHPSFIEENNEYKQLSNKEQAAQPWKGPIPQEVMQFWGTAHIPRQMKKSKH